MKQGKQDTRIVEGYLFAGEDDADLARQEQKKIAYLEQHMDHSVPEKVLMLYRKSIEERIFKTPVGYGYLMKMQEMLRESDEIKDENIPPIPLYVNFQPRLRRNTQPAQNRIKPVEEKSKLSPLILSVILNIALVLAVGFMFRITLKSDNPNILNYEEAITNKYSAWEEELSEREQAVREKERELNIQNQ